MLETILAIAGKPGLYKLISRGNRSLIVETLDANHKRMPAFGTDQIISLDQIAMYTDSEEVPLRQVFKNIYELEGGKATSLNYKKASKAELADFMAKALPNYDRDRVYPADMKKLAQWYNILIENGITNFDEAQETEGDSADDSKAE